MNGGKVMDLSKCGGVCKGSCKHYEIGVECPPEVSYEPLQIKPLSLADIKEWMQITEGKGGIGRRDLMEWLIAEVERLTAENGELSQHVCDECDPENYGWIFNRVEGKAVCGCIQEAEPFQILENALSRIQQAATGEIQVADDDTAGMAWVAKEAATALRSVLPLEYAEPEPYDADMEREY